MNNPENASHRSPDNFPQVENRELLFAGKIILVTGASRGLGADIALGMAKEGAYVIGPHRDPGKDRRAQQIAGKADEFSGQIVAPIADITSVDGREALLSQIREIGQSIDMIVHNAAGGMEEWADDMYASNINAHAKVELTNEIVRLNRELEEKSGTVPKPLDVFDIPSLWSLYYGHIEQLPEYERIARSKKQGDNLLLKAIGELQKGNEEEGIKGVEANFLRVCGHVIGDSMIGKVFKRNYPVLMAEIEKTAINGEFPLTQDMADAVIRVAAGEYEDGHIEYVGIPHWDKEEVRNRLSMYGEEALFVDDMTFFGEQGYGTFTVPESFLNEDFAADRDFWTLGGTLISRTGEAIDASFTVRNEHLMGHFKSETGISLFPGHKQIGLIDAALLSAIGSESERIRITSLSDVKFQKPVIPDDTLTIQVVHEPIFYDEVQENVGFASISDESGEVMSMRGFGFVKEAADHKPRLRPDQLIEAAAQTLGCIYMNTADGERSDLPVFQGFKAATFSGEVEIRDTILLHAQITSQTDKGFEGTVRVFHNDKPVATIEDISCGFMKQNTLKRYLERKNRQKGKSSQDAS